MKATRNELFWCIARVLVGLIFAYAGLAKLLEPVENFEAALLRLGVLSPAWIPWVARTIPWIEWILGVFFVLGYFPRVSGAGLCLLSLMFVVVLSSSRLFVTAGGTDCGCFGSSFLLRLTIHQVFILDLVNFSVLIRLLFLKNFPLSLESMWWKEEEGVQ